MAWGFGTWDKNGVDNNTGLVAVNIISVVRIEEGVMNASYSFDVPSGFSLDFVVMPDSTQSGAGDNWRRIHVSGNSIIVEPSGDNVAGNDRFPRSAMFIMGYAK